jgi:CubicO group peptidase (beta-lactamase class C family)
MNDRGIFRTFLTFAACLAFAANSLANEPEPSPQAAKKKHTAKKPAAKKPAPKKSAHRTPRPNCVADAKASSADIKGKLMLFMNCHSMSTGFYGAVLVANDRENLLNIDDAILIEEGYGLANRENGVVSPVRRDTKFLVGSVTKQFVSALTLKLIADGKFRLDDKVEALMPLELKFRDARWKALTVRNLLSHGSGIPDYLNNDGIRQRMDRLDWEAEQIIKYTSRWRLQFRPGSDARYSNTNFMILGIILERYLGMPWEQIVETYVSKPLLMANTGVYDPREENSYAAGFMDGGRVKEARLRDPETLMAVGDMYSTVRDLFRWTHALFSTGIIIPENLRDTYLAQPILREYSAGSNVSTKLDDDPDVFGKTAVYKTGHLNGYANIVMYFPDPNHKLVVIVLANVNDYPVKSLATKLAGIVFHTRSAVEVTARR